MIRKGIRDIFINEIKSGRLLGCVNSTNTVKISSFSKTGLVVTRSTLGDDFHYADVDWVQVD